MIVVLWKLLSFYYDVPKITTIYLLTKIELKGSLDKVKLQKTIKT